MAEWKKYTGAPEQLDEIKLAKHGYLIKGSDIINETSIYNWAAISCINLNIDNNVSYLICQHHPYADIIKRWCMTGEPVWIKIDKTVVESMPADLIRAMHIIEACCLDTDDKFYFLINTCYPNWNIPHAEYSFSPFE
jgi:hypothetical protein